MQNIVLLVGDKIYIASLMLKLLIKFLRLLIDNSISDISKVYIRERKLR